MKLAAKLRAGFAVNACKLQNAILNCIKFLLWPVGSIPKSEVRRLCIHRVGQIGDLVCSLDAIQSVRQSFPDTEIILLTSPGDRGNPGISGLSEAIPWVDELTIYYSDEIATWSGMIALCKKLRMSEFDLWIALPQDLTTFSVETRNMVFARCAGVRYATGFRVTTIRSFVYEQARLLRFEREGKRLLDAVCEAGYGGADEQQSLVVPNFRLKEAGQFIDQTGLIKKGPLLGIAPGAKRVMNRWPMDRFLEIAGRWCNAGGTVLVLGGPLDRPLGQAIAALCEERIKSVCGETSLIESVALFSQCCTVLANDSGPMQLASAVGVPCVITFSARDFPGKWYPKGADHIVFREMVPCSPCLSEQCGYDNLCMTTITVDAVWAVLEERLQKTRT